MHVLREYQEAVSALLPFLVWACMIFQCSSCTVFKKTVGFSGRSIASRARELLSTNSKRSWRPSFLPYVQKPKEPEIGSAKFPLSEVRKNEVSGMRFAKGLPGADPIRHISCWVEARRAAELCPDFEAYVPRKTTRSGTPQARTFQDIDFVHLRLSLFSVY